jgi:hypothetical protein
MKFRPMPRLLLKCLCIRRENQCRVLAFSIFLASAIMLDQPKNTPPGHDDIK